MRIAVAGFQHETNTFAPVKAIYEYFERAEGWPGLTRGADMFEVLPPIEYALSACCVRSNAPLVCPRR